MRELPAEVPADQRQAVPRDRPDQHRPGPHGAAALRQRRARRAHSMSLLGADAAAGRRRTATPCATPEPSVVVTVEPGATADTLVADAHRARGQGRALRGRRPPRQRRADHARPAAVGLRRHADLPGHRRAAAERPTASARCRPHVTVSAQPLGRRSSPVTVTADLSDATTGGSTVDPGRARRRRRRHRRRRLRHRR